MTYLIEMALLLISRDLFLDKSWYCFNLVIEGSVKTVNKKFNGKGTKKLKIRFILLSFHSGIG